MAYILVIMFFTASKPAHLDHVDSIRFDSRIACERTMKEIDSQVSRLLDKVENGDQLAGVLNVQTSCAPAG